MDSFALERTHREQDPPPLIATSFRRIDPNEDAPGGFSVSDASHCVVMCCHSYFIEKLISPFPKHAPISVCETQV